MVILLIICNNIGATTTRCVHSSGAWTGRNLILDESLTGNMYCMCLKFSMYDVKDV